MTTLAFMYWGLSLITIDELGCYSPPRIYHNADEYHSMWAWVSHFKHQQGNQKNMQIESEFPFVKSSKFPMNPCKSAYIPMNPYRIFKTSPTRTNGSRFKIAPTSANFRIYNTSSWGVPMSIPCSDAESQS